VIVSLGFVFEKRNRVLVLSTVVVAAATVGSSSCSEEEEGEQSKIPI